MYPAVNLTSWVPTVIVGEASAAYPAAAVPSVPIAKTVTNRARNGTHDPSQSPVGYVIAKLEATG